jgi:predicted RNA-binding Zn ribbon-like protein
MSWRYVEGVPLPDPVGGHPALDFCNTRAGWGTGSPKEYLTSVAALGLWAREAGLLPDDVGPAADAVGALAATATLSRAVALREAVYACALRRGTPHDWALVAGEAAAARAASELVPGDAGEPARWRLAAAGRGAGRPDPGLADGLDLPVLAVAVAAEDLLTSRLGSCVAACRGAGCGWLFADPRGRRRWCSMAVCGNRAKARAYAERHRTR